MALVEMTEVLTAAEAAALTESIRDSVVDLEQKIVRAYFGRAWTAMGYDSWDNYIDGEFKRSPLTLPREDRRTQVLSLRQQGMSLRAIGAATGVHHDTVSQDLSTVGFPTVELPEQITGLDGRSRPAARPTPTTATPTTATPATTDTTPNTCPTCGQPLPRTI